MKKRPYISHTLEARFFDAPMESSIEFQMDRVFKLLQESVAPDALLAASQWLVATGEKESSYLHRVFDERGPTGAAISVIQNDNKEDPASQSFVLWNGVEDNTKGASISCRFARKDGHSSSLNFSMRSVSESFRLGASASGITLILEGVRLYKPMYCSLVPDQYDPVFKDKPGVGWMLYLPRVLTTQQVPEARALVPVLNADKKQIGTIIVSVIDEVFSEQNPEHVKVANAIEIRLVDQDLLPRYMDL